MTRDYPEDMSESRKHLLDLIDAGPRVTAKTVSRGETAAYMMHNNEDFRYWCGEAGTEITRRQARKWMNREGIAYKTMKERQAK